MVEKAYEAMHTAQVDIYREYGIYFTFGLYSVNTYDKEMVALRERVSALITQLPGAMSIHNFTYEKEEKLFRFDVVVDFTTRDFAAFRKLVDKTIRENYLGSMVEINIDLDYA